MSTKKITNRASRSASGGEPRAYLVFCPPGHEFDYMVWPERRDAVDAAHDFADQSGDDGWQVYPLYAGKPIDV